MSAPRRRIAIIGAGLSGVAVAARLARLWRRAPEIVLIERGARFGPGLAYGTRNDAHLLNVPASNMSGRADAPGDFASWLQREHNGAAETFAPRRLFADYVEQLLRQTELATRLERVCDEALACRPHGEGWLVSLASGERIAADAVLLAVGHRPPAAPAPFARSGAPIIDAWDAHALERLPDGDVLLVGTGLTMVDAVLSLAPRRRGALYALSRRGLVPRSHLEGAAAAAHPPPMDLPLRLSDALRVFRREVAAMAARGEPWQRALDRLRADTPRLWRRLPKEAQRRFLRHLRPWWDVHRHRAAPAVAAQVAALQASGRLRVLAGRIVAAAPNAHGVLVQYRARGSQAERDLQVAAVVNCTGGDLELSRSTDPLLSQLMGEGRARPHASGLGLDVDADSRVIGADGTAWANLFAIGALTQGAFWECTAAPEIRVRAAAIAALLSAPLAVA